VPIRYTYRICWRAVADAINTGSSNEWETYGATPTSTPLTLRRPIRLAALQCNARGAKTTHSDVTPSPFITVGQQLAKFP
jgi:hypothetical protein